MRYCTSCKPQIQNALIHAKVKEVSEHVFSSESPTSMLHSGREVDQWHSLKEVQDMVLEDPKMQNLTTEEKKGYLSSLAQACDVKQHGVHANNATAACDVLATMDRISRKVGHSLLIYVLSLDICAARLPINEQEYIQCSLSHQVTSMMPFRLCGMAQTIPLPFGRTS